MDKGLIIQTRPGVGDLCMFLPYIQQIKDHNKNFQFTLITKKRTAAKQILKYEPSVNQIVYLEDEILEITKSKINNFSVISLLIGKDTWSAIFSLIFVHVKTLYY